MVKIDGNCLISVDKGQISCDLDGEAVILNLSSGVYYGLNAVGTHLWSLLQTPTTVAGLCLQVEREYPVDREQCERDLIGWLTKLAASGLIEVTRG